MVVKMSNRLRVLMGFWDCRWEIFVNCWTSGVFGEWMGPNFRFVCPKKHTSFISTPFVGVRSCTLHSSSPPPNLFGMSFFFSSFFCYDILIWCKWWGKKYKLTRLNNKNLIRSILYERLIRRVYTKKKCEKHEKCEKHVNI